MKFSGLTLKKLRKHAGYTQEELASKVGCTGRTIQNYEAETREPSATVVGIIAAVLKVERATLYSSEPMLPDETEEERIRRIVRIVREELKKNTT